MIGMTRTQFTDARRNIKKQIVPWISIVVIGMVSLVAYLSLIYSAEAIKRTVSAYYNEYRFWDLEISATLLMDDGDLRALRAIPGVELVEPVWQVSTELLSESANESVTVQSLSKEISVPELITGRLPSQAGECALEQQLQESLGLAVGDRIQVESASVAGVEALNVTEYIITGVFRHPDHISFEVPETPYVLVTEDCFDRDGLDGAFMKARIRVADTPADRYGKIYPEIIKPVRETVDALASRQPTARENRVRAVYEQQIQDGQEKLDEAAAKLRDAEEQLADGRRQLDDGWAQLKEAEEKLVAMKAQLDAGAQALGEAEYQLAAIPPWFAGVADQIDPSSALSAQYKDGLHQYGEGRAAWYAAGEEYLDGLTLYEKNRKKLIKAVKKHNIPQIITEDIDKCISGIEINKQTADDIAKLEAEKKIAAEENENEDVINQINKIFSDGASDTAEDNLIKPGQQEAKLETPDFKLHGSEELTCVVSDTTSDKFEQKKETEEVAQKPEINKNKTNPENMNQTPKNNTIKEEPATPIAVAAPVPQEQKTKIQSNSQEENNKQQIKKEKNIKKTKFVIENNKEEYIAKPRTNKELKKLKKQNKKNNKKSKVKKTPYEVTNNKDTYLAVPRNKQEMKEYGNFVVDGPACAEA